MIVLTLGNAGTNRGAFFLRIETDGILVRASDERAARRALIELERRMGERGGPFLSTCEETLQPSCSEVPAGFRVMARTSLNTFVRIGCATTFPTNLSSRSGVV